MVLGALVGTLVGMTGVGAGSLVTPTLALMGVPPAVAVGSDLAYAAISKSVGALAHRAGSTVDLRLAGLLAVGSLPAAAAMIGVLHVVDRSALGPLITAWLAFALVATALVLLAGRSRFAAFAARYEARLAPHRTALTVAAGAFLGASVTMSSIGAGALGAVILVALYPSMPAARIAGTDIAHAVPLTLVAGLGHFWLGNVDFGLVGNLLAGAIPGIIVGSLAAGRLPEGLVQRLLAVVLLFAGTRLAIGA